jgi:hypothetical protein
MKYDMTEVPHTWYFRIRALRDIPRHGVKAGDLGGYVVSPDNLSQEGDCWIGKGCSAVADSKIMGNALITGNVVTWGFVEVRDNAVVKGSVDIRGCKAQVYGNALIIGEELPSGLASMIEDDVSVSEYAVICGRFRIFGQKREFKGTEIFALNGDPKELDGDHVDPRRPKS